MRTDYAERVVLTAGIVRGDLSFSRRLAYVDRSLTERLKAKDSDRRDAILVNPR